MNAVHYSSIVVDPLLYELLQILGIQNHHPPPPLPPPRASAVEE